MSGMSPEEAQKSMAEKAKICMENCGKCPSYEGTGEDAWLFCAKGKSTKITEEKGCVCDPYPVTEQMGLRWGYYCTRGSGKEMVEAGK